jgi:hypothetical protein
MYCFETKTRREGKIRHQFKPSVHQESEIAGTFRAAAASTPCVRESPAMISAKAPLLANRLKLLLQRGLYSAHCNGRG